MTADTNSAAYRDRWSEYFHNEAASAVPDNGGPWDCDISRDGGTTWEFSSRQCGDVARWSVCDALLNDLRWDATRNVVTVHCSADRIERWTPTH